MESLSSIAAFVHAAEQRSYVSAGRILGISPSAVSKSVARLEGRLGVRLLHRTTRSIGLTEQGAVFFERCKRVLDDLDDAEAVLLQSRAQPKGRLRISVPHIFGHHLLLPLLPKFVKRFPELELDIDFDDQVVDVVAQSLDVVVRSGELADTRLVARRLGDQHFVVCASAKYLAHRGTPSTPADLVQHACIRFKYPTSGRLAQWSFESPFADVLVPTGLVFNNTDAGLWAAMNDFGLAHLPTYVAKPQIDAGTLKPVLTGFMAPLGALSLVWPSNKQLSPKVRAFVEFVMEQVKV
ncbi:LysR family transcriptional regulator [Variovorax sp. YR566]|uniref:LysR family transcriptional regulator n=1 Tax=Variovorax sp. YR566 TaxID=3450237 RepID=UPI003F7DCCF2